MRSWSGAEAKQYRMVAARLNYMAQDDAWIQYPAKELCRSMARPTRAGFQRAKKLVRFLKGVGGTKLVYSWQSEKESKEVTIFVDSDWAGCVDTRRSTSGGVMKVGKHVVRTWSSTQPTVSTSSGEAELIAMYDGATRGCGVKTILNELGLTANVQMARVCTDSSVAKSFSATRGLGKMRHIDVKLLWLQEQVRSGRIAIEKIRGETNVADVLTKPQHYKKLRELTKWHGIVPRR